MLSSLLKTLVIIVLFVTSKITKKQISNKATLEHGGTLKSVPDCYKNQEMCNKAVGYYPHALEFVF